MVRFDSAGNRRDAILSVTNAQLDEAGRHYFKVIGEVAQRKDTDAERQRRNAAPADMQRRAAASEPRQGPRRSDDGFGQAMDMDNEDMVCVWV